LIFAVLENRLIQSR